MGMVKQDTLHEIRDMKYEIKSLIEAIFLMVKNGC